MMFVASEPFSRAALNAACPGVCINKGQMTKLFVHVLTIQINRESPDRLGDVTGFMIRYMGVTQCIYEQGRFSMINMTHD